MILKLVPFGAHLHSDVLSSAPSAGNIALMNGIPTVLFVCTGNVYRSRYAEAVFNHHAEAAGLGWCAFSRGLAPEMADFDGLYPATQHALEARGIELHHTAATKTPLTEEDLGMAHLIIALSENEHRPMVARQFPAWLDQFNFWEVGDLPISKPEEALPLIGREVETLLADLTAAGRECQDPKDPKES